MSADTIHNILSLLLGVTIVFMIYVLVTTPRRIKATKIMMHDYVEKTFINWLYKYSSHPVSNEYSDKDLREAFYAGWRAK